MVVETKFKFESRLCEGNIITPLTFVVLKWSKVLVCVICFIRVVKSVKRKEKGSQKGFFINVSDEIAGLAPTSLRVRWRTQGYVVLCRKCLFIGRFQRKVLNRIRMENIICYPKHGEMNIGITFEWKPLLATKNMEKLTLASHQNG